MNLHSCSGRPPDTVLSIMAQTPGYSSLLYFILSPRPRAEVLFNLIPWRTCGDSKQSRQAIQRNRPDPVQLITEERCPHTGLAHPSQAETLRVHPLSMSNVEEALPPLPGHLSWRPGAICLRTSLQLTPGDKGPLLSSHQESQDLNSGL